jgi:hypothetical protein
MGLEQGPLSLVSTIEVLLERKNSGSGLESREYCLRDPTSDSRSVDIVRLRTQTMEFFICKRTELGKLHAYRELTRALENYQWSRQPCFEGAAILIGGFLSQIPRRDRHKSLQTYESFVEGQFNARV